MAQNPNSDPPFTKQVVFSSNGKKVAIEALIDTGAQGALFVDEIVAQQICDELGIAPVELAHPKYIRGYSGGEMDKITHAIYPRMRLGGHFQTLAPLMITRMTHPVIIGKTWMRLHGVQLNMGTGKLTFAPGVCAETCRMLTLKRLKSETTAEIAEPEKKAEILDVAAIGAAPFNLLAKKHPDQIFAVSYKDINDQLNKDQKPQTDPRAVIPQEYHK